MSTATIDPASAVAGTRARTSLGETVGQTLSMAWRALKTMRRNPEQFFDVTIQPLLFTAMFAYVFGGAISGDVGSYLPLMIPGIVAQTVLTTCMATGVQLREDMEKGVFDRFKSLPIRADRAARRADGRRPRALPDRGEPDVRRRASSWATAPRAGCSACWRRSSSRSSPAGPSRGSSRGWARSPAAPGASRGSR